MHKKILIIAEPDDAHAITVAARIEQDYDCQAIIWDSSRFPSIDSLTYHLVPNSRSDMTITHLEKGLLSLCQLNSIWWRRPAFSHIPKDVKDESARSYCRSESYHFLRGTLDSLDIPVINSPHWEDQANRKPYQLKCATECELTIPRTLITSNPERVKKFYHDLDGKVIYKPLKAVSGSTGGTQKLLKEYFEGLGLLRNSPIIFQQEISPLKDIRVTVVGNQIFAAESSSQYLDWRSDPSIKWTQHQLPNHLKERIKLLMKKMNLMIGSIDFRTSKDGDYFFFEINPNGQFLFLELDDSRLRISSAVAALLASC